MLQVHRPRRSKQMLCGASSLWQLPHDTTTSCTIGSSRGAATSKRQVNSNNYLSKVYQILCYCWPDARRSMSWMQPPHYLAVVGTDWLAHNCCFTTSHELPPCNFTTALLCALVTSLSSGQQKMLELRLLLPACWLHAHPYRLASHGNIQRLNECMNVSCPWESTASPVSCTFQRSTHGIRLQCSLKWHAGVLTRDRCLPDVLISHGLDTLPALTCNVEC